MTKEDEQFLFDDAADKVSKQNDVPRASQRSKNSKVSGVGLGD